MQGSNPSRNKSCFTDVTREAVASFRLLLILSLPHFSFISAEDGKLTQSLSPSLYAVLVPGELRFWSQVDLGSQASFAPYALRNLEQVAYHL